MARPERLSGEPVGHHRALAEPSARRQATRERLMDAAVELFGERGVLAASVEEICERAGFTRGAFYSNFESKDELCLAVVRRKGDQHLAAMQAAIEVIPQVAGTAGGSERADPRRRRGVSRSTAEEAQ